ncbi:hypothetical protein TRV_08030 [Trichophyton verrucosum HKI 0517]|uniref:Copper acquisition factor BIM1-like domain-containing protein n=1 Tax=Trichophyton verrucosum (strain HKI 0517) TaxID=663202 RepID=D4DLF6_TRIVH|nr:uncharacterized protein TRV_08030 [Trichophyton verrucosum HKI 0517]EFE37334.1 hypothetical protein TRV_08030 [Trichophyton verrucosum HKI 0517]
MRRERKRERETERSRDESRCWSKADRGESSITSFNRPTFPARRLGRCYWLCSTGKGDFSSLLFAGRWPAIPVASHLFASRRPQREREKESRTALESADRAAATACMTLSPLPPPRKKLTSSLFNYFASSSRLRPAARQTAIQPSLLLVVVIVRRCRYQTPLFQPSISKRRQTLIMRTHFSLGPFIGVFLTLAFATLAAKGHTVIVYPGWRENNLHSNGTVDETNGAGVAIRSNTSELLYPYETNRQQPPGGGTVTSTNRTKWPINGGAISFQPGWFPGHKTALIYINLGMGTTPLNMSLPMVPPFQITGPTVAPYPGTFCLPQVPLPANISVKAGDNATIQVVEAARHGAVLYNLQCVDITFAEPSEVEPVTRDNCFNSTNITSSTIYAIPDKPTNAAHVTAVFTALGVMPLLLAGYYFSIML